MLNMLVGNFLLLLNLSYFSIEILKPRYKNKVTLIIAIVLGVAILASRSYPSLQLYGTFIMLLFYVVFVFCLFTGSLLKKLFVIIIYVAIISISEILTSNIMNLIFDLSSSDLNTLLYTLALIFSNCLTFAILSIIAKYIQLNSKINLPKSTWLIFALPITTFLFLISLNEYFATFRSNILIAPIVIGLLVTNFVTIYIFFQTIKTMELKNEIKGMQVKYDTINSLYQNNFDFMHDTIWELNHIYKNIQNQDYNSLTNQVEKLSNNILKKFNVINTNSSIVSSSLNYRLGDISHYNIEVKTDIIYNNFSFMSIQAQNELFSSIINNAIDSCIASKFNKSYVLIKSNLINSQIVMQCLYSYSPHEYSKENDLFIKKFNKLVSSIDGKTNYSINDNYFETLVVFNLNSEL